MTSLNNTTASAGQFFIIGFPKCGTTTLFELLAQHPEVGPCSPKEPNFFCFEENFSQGLNFYHSIFKTTSRTLIRGEASVRYSVPEFREKAAHRISACFPSAKIIFLVRHPIERIESDYAMLRRLGKESRASFSQAVREGAYVDTSRYWDCVSVYRKYFADDQIKIMFMEDLVADPKTLLRQTCEFLNISADAPIASTEQWSNKASVTSRDRSFTQRLRTIPGFESVRTRIPASLRRLVEPFFIRKDGGKPKWSRRARIETAAALREDARQLLRYCERSESFWDLK